ncbi:MAG TPA: FecR family protein [Puia sp.]|nr:FecR family protein [Puia sp.]
MSQPEFDHILRKYLDGNCTQEEEKIILEWYETFISESEIALSDHEKLEIRQKIWANVRPGLFDHGHQRPAAIPLFKRSWRQIAVAASLILVVAAGYWYFHPSAAPTVQDFSRDKIPEGYIATSNPDNSIRTIDLADGSKVELQPQSVLHYPKQFTGPTRNVYLTGNAFFQVAHDAARHFMVHTEEGLLAEVLGTSFYVLHDKAGKKVEVAVVTGKVSVYEEKEAVKTSPETNRIILTPNQKVSYKPLNNQFVTSLVEEPKPIEQNTVTTPGTSFVFEEAPLSKVLTDLQTSYGITIQTENDQIGNCHFSGDISRQSLYDKLDVICKSIQSSYEVRGTVIYIRGKGCN